MSRWSDGPFHHILNTVFGVGGHVGYGGYSLSYIHNASVSISTTVLGCLRDRERGEGGGGGGGLLSL